MQTLPACHFMVTQWSCPQIITINPISSLNLQLEKEEREILVNNTVPLSFIRLRPLPCQTQ